MQGTPQPNHDLASFGGCEVLAADIDVAEKLLLSLPQVECPVHHHFGPGVYIREVILPGGSIIIGHRQKTAHLNNFIRGKVAMLNDDGTTTVIEAPMTFVSPPGRKIGFIIETVLWQNIYATEERDVEKLEETYLDKSENWQLEWDKSKDILRMGREADRDDYLKFLADCSLTPEEVLTQSMNEDDRIDMPYGWFKTAIFSSDIQGKGLFATSPFMAGEVIAPARIGNKRTPAGRYTNHSCTPNAMMKMNDDGNVYLVALHDISGCNGGNHGEEITIDYRQYINVVKVVQQ